MRLLNAAIRMLEAAPSIRNFGSVF
jgi:hypothetical protein